MDSILHRFLRNSLRMILSSYRLPTQRPGAHRDFFRSSIFILKLKFISLASFVEESMKQRVKHNNNFIPISHIAIQRTEIQKFSFHIDAEEVSYSNTLEQGLLKIFVFGNRGYFSHATDILMCLGMELGFL